MPIFSGDVSWYIHLTIGKIHGVNVSMKSQIESVMLILMQTIEILDSCIVHRIRTQQWAPIKTVVPQTESIGYRHGCRITIKVVQHLSLILWLALSSQYHEPVVTLAFSIRYHTIKCGTSTDTHNRDPWFPNSIVYRIRTQQWAPIKNVFSKIENIGYGHGCRITIKVMQHLSLILWVLSIMRNRPASYGSIRDWTLFFLTIHYIISRAK